MSTVAIDFDGVLSAYSGWKGAAAPLDPPIKGALEAIRTYQDAEFIVCIYTSRADSPKQINKIQFWLLENGMETKRVAKIHITDRKPPAILYIDDRAWLFRGEFPTVEFLNTFKTWQGY